MGDGSTTPDNSPLASSRQSGFETRESNTQAPVESYENVLSGERTTSNNSSYARWESGTVSAAEAASTDRGYSEDLAVYFDSQRTRAIEYEFEQAVESYKDTLQSGTSDLQTMDAEARFIGGVAVSRSDSDVSTRDIFDHDDANTVRIESIGDYDSTEAFKQDLFDELDDTLERLDEYVAGQVMANLEAVTSRRITRDHLNKDPVGGIISSDRANSELFLNPETRNPLDQTEYQDYDPDDFQDVDSPKEVDRLGEMGEKVGTEIFKSFIDHEISHVYHQRVMGVEADGKIDTVKQAKQASPDQIPVNNVNRRWEGDNRPSETGGFGETPSKVQEQLADEIEEAGEQMVATMKGESPQGEAEVHPTRSYQTVAADEMFACGYELYQRDVITSVTEQRPLADVYESRMLDAGWEETSMDSLQTTGSPDMAKDNVSDVHIPEDMNESDVGEVALFEFEDGLDTDQNHAAGFVRTVTDDYVSFTYMGNDVVMPREKIDSVKRYDWGG